MNHCRYLPYTLTLRSPAIMTALGGDPNSSLTLPFIPGAAIRGVVAKVLGDPGEDGTKRDMFHDLVLGGKANYLNAYPSTNDQRALPVPVSLRCRKNSPKGAEPVTTVDLAAFDGHCTNDEGLSECWPDEQLKALGEGYVTIGGAQPTRIHPKMSARIHHQRDRRKGRAWKDRQGTTHGAIFSFESLDAGQAFQGLIQVWGDTDEECRAKENRIKELLGDSILVGRSRRAGYGGMASIAWGELRDREVEGAGTEGLRPVNGDIAPGEQFRLLLTSACIVRNAQTGQVDPVALPNILPELLGDRAKLIRKRWSFETIGGFNRKWRLELPQALAISAGAVFVFEAVRAIPLSELLVLEHEGLGERGEEGCGRFVFLDAPLSPITLYSPQETRSPNDLSGEPPPLVLDVERRILARKVAGSIEECAAELVGKASDLPSNSLIGRLRLPLRGNPEQGIQTLQRWLGSTNEAQRLKGPAMKQLERCRMDGSRSLAELILDVTGEEKILERLKVDALAQRYHIVSEASAKRFIKERWEALAASLIDAVLAGLAVRNKTKEGWDGQELV